MAPLRKILMVEDDPDIQTVAAMALEMVGGFEVAVCPGGAEALARVEGFAPDLILLDVMMPDLDGPAVLLRLRANPATAHFPVVFMTAKARNEEVSAYSNLGALAVVTKPFDPMTLSQTLSAIWERAQGATEAASTLSAP